MINASLTDLVARLHHERGKLGQAWFSSDKSFRYLLLRGDGVTFPELDDGLPMVGFVMLNPSTADADQNDPTISRCIKFACRFMKGQPHRVAIANLYALRATDPEVTFAHSDPSGGSVNDHIIMELARSSNIIIAAWGADRRSTIRGQYVSTMIRARIGVLHRLGPPSKDGHPRHPLYLKSSTSLEVCS